MGHCANTGHTGDTIQVNVGSRVEHNGGEQAEKRGGGANIRLGHQTLCLLEDSLWQACHG